MGWPVSHIRSVTPWAELGAVGNAPNDTPSRCDDRHSRSGGAACDDRCDSTLCIAELDLVKLCLPCVAVEQAHPRF